jgi:hypothetical protein
MVGWHAICSGVSGQPCAVATSIIPSTGRDLHSASVEGPGHCCHRCWQRWGCCRCCGRKMLRAIGSCQNWTCSSYCRVRCRCSVHGFIGGRYRRHTARYSKLTTRWVFQRDSKLLLHYAPRSFSLESEDPASPDPVSSVPQFYRRLENAGEEITEDFLWGRLEPLLHYLPPDQVAKVGATFGILAHEEVVQTPCQDTKCQLLDWSITYSRDHFWRECTKLVPIAAKFDLHLGQISPFLVHTPFTISPLHI